MYGDKRIAVIIAAAGSGTRMGSGISKQYIKIGDDMILEKALKAFSDHPCVDDIYLVVKKEDMEFCLKEFVDRKQIPKIRAIISGGEHRQASVYNGLKVISKLGEERGEKVQPENEISTPDYVLVHDGARPFVSEDEISRLVEAVDAWGAATLGVPVKDTIATVERSRIKETPDRNLFYAIHTPQGFKFSKLFDTHRQAMREGFIGTDDAGLVHRLGHHVALVPGSYTNIKITTSEDLQFARSIVVSAKESPVNSAMGCYVAKENSSQETGSPMAKRASTTGWRIGTGFDVHAFAPNRQLVLGGVRIPWGLGLQGHSDADVLVHAVMDALLGACGLGDIGKHFPDHRPEYKDISSLYLLEKVKTAIRETCFEIGNVDAVVMAEKPRIAPYIAEMKKNIAQVLEIGCEDINIKATTTEGLGFCGRGEGIAAMASAAVYRKTADE
jgi:2-C-methyl-D-erythritol 4-phosphate cytidylyltransferase/2-C-methyl-D-erythritol 2,4-cyclodiphosphate synthase